MVSVLLAEVTVADWIGAAAIVLGAVALSYAIRRVFRRLVSNHTVQDNVADLSTQMLTIIILILASLYAMSLLDVELGPLLGALGLSGVILGISLQPVLGNFVGSVLLHGSRPVRIGDQVDTNGFSGTVIDITNRSVELLTFDGVTVHVPNLQVLENPLTNRTSDDERRTSLFFDVSYDTDLRMAQQVVTRALRDLDGISEFPGPDVLMTQFGDSGITFEARFWHASEELIARWVISEAGIAVREALQTANISIPFPQRVWHQAESDSSD